MGQNRHLGANIAPHGHLEASGHQIVGTTLTFPGVRGKLIKTLITLDGTELKAGTTIIIQPLNRDKPEEEQKFIITPYKKNKKTKNKNQPESHRDIITDLSYPIQLDQPEHFLHFNEEHFRRSQDVLFPHPDSPSLDEITQCRIPDCFLLAAIQAIMSHPEGKSFIRGMVRQNNDGTTTVRFFDPITLKPEYIKIENSIIVDRLGELNLHSALWVHMLEKAYAARGKKDSDTLIDASVSSVYSSGGASADALTSLTGLKTTYNAFSLSPLQIEAFLGENFYTLIKSMLDLPGILPEQLINCLASLPSFQLNALYNQFGAVMGNEPSERQALARYLEFIKCYHQDQATYKETLKNRSVKKLEEKHPEVAKKFQKIFNKTALFSGYYTDDQLQVYQNITQALAEGKLITTGTNTRFEKEDNTIGLIDNHAYTMLGAFEQEIEIKNSAGKKEKIKARFVRVRNPWGKMEGLLDKGRDLVVGGIGRVYEQDPKNFDIRIQGSNGPIFNVELSDFCKYFDHYNISSSANQKFHRDAEKEKYISELTQFISQFSIHFSSSVNELLDAQVDYQDQLAKLINIELMELDKLTPDLIQAINDLFNTRQGPSLERTAVESLLNANLFPTVSGSVGEVKEHIYSLLKLKWLKSHDFNDKSLETQLIDTIMLHSSQMDLWESLSTTHSILNMVVMTRANAHHNNIDTMLALCTKLQNGMEELKIRMNSNMPTYPELIEAIMEALINNFIKLEQMYHQFSTLDLVVRKFNYYNNHEEHLTHIATYIQAFEQYLKPIIEVRPLFSELWALRKEIRTEAASLEKKHEITPDEYSDIKKATECMFSNKLKSVGKKLLDSSDPAPASENRRKLGEKMIKAGSLVNTITQALQSIGFFFAKVSSYIGTFFHCKNNYELPAIKLPAKEQAVAPKVG